MLLNVLCLYSTNGTTDDGTACIQQGLLNVLTPQLRPTVQEKKNPFKILLYIDNTPGHPRDLTETYNEMNVFMPANTSVLQPMKPTLT